MKPAVLIVLFLLSAVVAFPQTKSTARLPAQWTRTETLDRFTGATSTVFTLQGTFVVAPSRSGSKAPVIMAQCRTNKKGKGELLNTLIEIGATLDSHAGIQDDVVAGVRAYSGVSAEYRLDGGPVKRFPPLAHSEDFSVLYLESAKSSFGLIELFLPDLLYEHHKEPVKQAVIRVPEWQGGFVVMQFDMPDPTELAETCGIYHKR